MTPPPPPRLHVLFRPERGHAVVIRRGPSTVFCTIGWDVARDAFSVGQWCKHKLYAHRCDLSADGRWLVYFALNGRWDSETKGAFTALSRAPYLKAVRLWPQGHTWGGGGLFLGPAVDPEAPVGEPIVVDRLTRLGPGRYADRLRRDGWTHATADKVAGGGKAWEKALGTGWVLRKKVVEDQPERHQLRGPDGSLTALDGWDWAEVDAPRQRVVWTEGGVLYAARFGSTGLEPAKVLHDFRGMTFQAIEAPYRDVTVIEPRP